MTRRTAVKAPAGGEERNIRLLLGFEGTAYGGWQSQLNGKTLQELFEKVLAGIFPGQKINLIGSSRTDAGVHALGFTAHFKVRGAIPDAKLKSALNHYLPDDVVVFDVKTVPASFHARYDAKSKIYRYDIWNDRTRPLFEAPFSLWYPGDLDAARMKKAAAHFKGKHDFAAFRDSGDDKKNTVRTVKKISLVKKGKLIRLTIQADGFLTHMIRIIAGTLIQAGAGRIDPASIPAILRSKDRKKAGPTAKALGLTLVKVLY